MKKNKILLFDIETSPNLGYIWGKYEQNVIEYVSEWYVLCFAYKWLDEKSTHAVGLPHFKTYNKQPENDKELLLKLWDLFDEADIVIAHNGQSFDVKKINARFLAHGITPPSPYKIIDTKLIAKKYFNFNSNKLDDLGNNLGLGRKLETGGFELWKGCMNGDKKSWQTMLKYNIQDVILLEKVYLTMRPYITNHPDVGLIDGKKEACPNCSSEKTHRRGYYMTKNSKWQRHQCQGCGAWFKGEKVKEKTNKMGF